MDPDAERIRGDPVLCAFNISQVDLAKGCAICAEVVEEVIRREPNGTDDKIHICIVVSHDVKGGTSWFGQPFGTIHVEIDRMPDSKCIPLECGQALASGRRTSYREWW